jgi:hypothetical protein
MFSILGFSNSNEYLTRPLLGVNAGPTPHTGGLQPEFVNVSDQFVELGIESVRSEDLSNGSFDVMFYFPDRYADPINPESYSWEETDSNFLDIIDLSIDPFVRLGQSWRNMTSWGAYELNEPTGYPGYGPFWSGERSISTTMLNKGPDIFVNLIDRYTNEELWGFNPLKDGYVEIWNEPNIIGINTEMQEISTGPLNPANPSQFQYSPNFPSYTWDGTPEEFYEFFANTAIQLKNTFPEIKIGGPGIHNVGLALPVIDPPSSSYKNEIGLEWTENFLSYLSERDVDLDFFSWHYYGKDPEVFIMMHDKADELLTKYGYDDTEQILSEWNTDFSGGNVSTPLGAAQSNAIWIALQNRAPNVADAYFYRGADGSFVPNGDGFPIWVNAEGTPIGEPNFGDYGVGLLTSDGTYKASAYAFDYWADMARRQSININQYYSSSLGENGLYALGGLQSGSEGRDLRILTSYLSQANSPNLPIAVDLLEVAEQFNFDPSTISVYTIENQFGPPVQQEISNEGIFTLPQDRVVLIQMDDIPGDPIVNYPDENPSFLAITKSLDEGSDIVGRLVANQHASWSVLQEYGDSSAFSIDSRSGQLLFKETPFFNEPGDIDRNNIYDLKIQATSGTEIVIQTLSVEVNPISINNVYRLYNASQSVHLLSLEENEIDILTGSGWVNEGTIYSAPEQATAEVFRFYIASENRHFYTALESERDIIIGDQATFSGWDYEGGAFSAYSTNDFPEDAVAIVRYFNKESGNHMYSTSTFEQGILDQDSNWLNEGIAWYGNALPTTNDLV